MLDDKDLQETILQDALEDEVITQEEIEEATEEEVKDIYEIRLTQNQYAKFGLFSSEEQTVVSITILKNKAAIKDEDGKYARLYIRAPGEDITEAIEELYEGMNLEALLQETIEREKGTVGNNHEETLNFIKVYSEHEQEIKENRRRQIVRKKQYIIQYAQEAIERANKGEWTRIHKQAIVSDMTERQKERMERYKKALENYREGSDLYYKTREDIQRCAMRIQKIQDALSGVPDLE